VRDRAQPSAQARKRADAGQDDAVAARTTSGSAVTATLRPAAFSAFSTECRLPAP
jgi:hypothetical protein